MTGLYLHIPFCKRKCYYCDFYSVTDRYDLVPRFIEAVTSEAESYTGAKIDTLYLGGGTPSLLGAGHLLTLTQRLSDIFDLSGLAEATIEVNPDTATIDLFNGIIQAGFTRISLGIQSLNDRELATSGRIHNAVQSLNALHVTSRAGISNISADLIIGLPGQDWDSLRNTIERLLIEDIKHVSAYCLSIEEGTPFAVTRPGDLPDDDMQAELYIKASSYLKQVGFEHYEISNFCQPGYECRHNLNYWRCGEYIGLGPSAASHLNGLRYKNDSNLHKYLADPLSARIDEEILERRAKIGEAAMLRLRLLEEGLDYRELTEQFGDCADDLRSCLERMVKRSLLLKRDGRYCIPADRILTSNPILAEVLN
jgi:oxygen-independent coproporphyrinogen-3 oxidase